jgi:hypothetical protein
VLAPSVGSTGAADRYLGLFDADIGALAKVLAPALASPPAPSPAPPATP